MNNTIILIKNEKALTKKQFQSYTRGDLIMGENESPEEIKRWSIEQEEEAKTELEKLNCEYKEGPELIHITEYALEYCECDEEGDFIQGSDYYISTAKHMGFSDKENKAAISLYVAMGWDTENIIHDIVNDYLTNVCFKGNDYVWYLDESKNALINVDTNKITEDKDEIELLTGTGI